MTSLYNKFRRTDELKQCYNNLNSLRVQLQELTLKITQLESQIPKVRDISSIEFFKSNNIQSCLLVEYEKKSK